MAPAILVPGPSGPMLGGFFSGGGGGTTTLDPSNKSTHITLSGGNLIATTGAGSGDATAVRSVASHSTGKLYCEFTLTTKAGSDQDGAGLCNGSFVPDGGTFLGGNNNGIAYYDGGHTYLNGANVHSQPTLTTGDVVCMAIDLTISPARAWWRKNGGDWNNSALNDPTAGSTGGGIDISALGTPLYAAIEGETSGVVWTANFGGSAYAQSVPTGFSNW